MFLPLDGNVKKTTPKAVLFEFENYGTKTEKWIPRSVIDDGDSVSEGDIEICVAEWFCDKEEISA